MTTTLGSGEKRTTLSSPMANTLSTASPSNSSPLLIPKVSPFKRRRPTHLDIPDLKPTRTDYSTIFRDFARQIDAVCFGGNGFGVVSRNGKKKFMEDSHRIVPCLVGSSKKVSLFFFIE